MGAAGRRLLQTADVLNPNATFFDARLIGNSASSDYNALQIQFQRRLSSGLQALASYTFSHSIDTASAGSYGNGSNLLIGGQNNRGASQFDIREAPPGRGTHEIPTNRLEPLTKGDTRLSVHLNTLNN